MLFWGELIPIIDVPSNRLIVRQSCGCLDPRVTQLVAGPIIKMNVEEPIERNLVKQRKCIVAEMVRVADAAAAGLAAGWAERLFDTVVAALIAATDKEASIRFLSTLDEILRQVIATEGDIKVWSQVVAALRRQLLPYFSMDKGGTLSRDHVEDIWLQAQALIGRVT